MHIVTKLGNNYYYELKKKKKTQSQTIMFFGTLEILPISIKE